jgi:hypothetical protein
MYIIDTKSAGIAKIFKNQAPIIIHISVPSLAIFDISLLNKQNISMNK